MYVCHLRTFSFFYCSGDPRALHSFPTRRSSDLADNLHIDNTSGQLKISRVGSSDNGIYWDRLGTQDAAIQFASNEQLNIDNNFGNPINLRIGADGSETTYLSVNTTGIDVTGTATMDGLTVDGVGVFDAGTFASTDILTLRNGTNTNGEYIGLNFNNDIRSRTSYIRANHDSTTSQSLSFGTDSSGTATQRLRIDGNGDFSFYDDTDSTQALFWDASAERLGLGTTSPSATLDISDSFGAINLESSTGTNQVQVKVLNTGGSAFFGRDNNAGSWFGTGEAYATTLRSDGAYPMIFRVNGGNRLVLDDGGNVGIGTTSPNYLLDVEGSGSAVRVNSTSGDSNIHLRVADTTSLNIINFGDSGSSTAGRILYRHTGDSMAFNVAGNEAVRIINGGNVGLGNTAPAKNLHITDSSSPTIRFSRDNSFYWDIGHTSSDFQFISESGGTVLHMNYDGNIGIGTTSPANLLSIESTGQFAGMNIKSASSNGISYIDFGDADDANIGGINYDNSTDTLQFRNGNANHVFLKSDGKVGIGTTSPSAVLTVDGTTKTFGDSGITLKRTGSVTGEADIILAGVSGSEALSFRVNDSEKFRVQNNGYFGIGTTSPSTKLEVNGDIGIGRSAGAYTFREVVGGGLRAGIHSNASNELLFKYGANTEGMRITSSGNVGIGETNIDAKLHLTTASAGLINQKLGSATSAALRLGIPA